MVSEVGTFCSSDISDGITMDCPFLDRITESFFSSSCQLAKLLRFQPFRFSALIFESVELFLDPIDGVHQVDQQLGFHS